MGHSGAPRDDFKITEPCCFRETEQLRVYPPLSSVRLPGVPLATLLSSADGQLQNETSSPLLSLQNFFIQFVKVAFHSELFAESSFSLWAWASWGYFCRIASPMLPGSSRFFVVLPYPIGLLAFSLNSMVIYNSLVFIVISLAICLFTLDYFPWHHASPSMLLYQIAKFFHTAHIFFVVRCS